MNMIKPLFILFILSLSVLSSYSQELFNLNKWVKNLPGTVVDIDSNVYHIQKLGKQVWLKENLKVTKFNNGKEIKLIHDDSIWIISQIPSFSKLIGIQHTSNGQDSINSDEILYNYFVIEDSLNVCPVGWKIPDTSDWAELIEYVDHINQEFMRQFYPKNINDTVKNIGFFEIIRTAGHIGFSSAPFGYRSSRTGKFVNYYDFGYWWTNDLNYVATAWARIQNRGLGIDDIHLEETRGHKQIGYSIRCIKE